MRRMLILGSIIAAVILITVFDRSLFPAIGGSFRAINLTLTVAIYLLIIIDKNFSLLIFASSTLLSALMGNSLVVFHLLIGLSVLILMDWIFESFLTNRSYYTLLILGTIGWFLYYLLLSVLIGISGLLSTSITLPQLNFTWVSQIFFGSLVLIVLLSISYILTNFLSKKFKSYFIIS